MVDFNCCDHECVCQHNGHLEAAQQYSSLISKVMNKNADSEPVSKEDKDKWNNKANQDVVDLIKMMVEKHEEKLDELEEGLDKKVKLILYDLGFGDNVLAKYATIEYVNELVAKIKNETSDLSKYALKADLDTIKNDIQNKINNLTTEINNIKVTGGKDYSVESFNYNSANGQLVLKQKNGGEFTVSIVAGGIDTSKLVTKEQLANELTKYAEINKLKKLQIGGNQYTLYDPNGNGVIKIDGGSSGSGTGKDGGRYKVYFKCVDKNTTSVQAPNAGAAPESGSGWTEHSVNRGPNQNVWMTQVFIDSDGNYGQYITPICITGEDGTSAGTDQSNREFIYRQGVKGQTFERPYGDNPDGWTDNPQGVTSKFVNEWVSVRVKDGKTWGIWSEPILWSHYGDNGTDGDGVEYIFAISQTKQAPTDNPHDWYDNAASKADTNHQSFNKDEYIKEESKGTWTDDPQEVPQGGTAWVSVRKKRNDDNPGSSETEDAYWHQYSNPTLWAYHAKDGVSDAITADVTGETRYLYLKDDNTNKAYSGDAGLYLYNSGTQISFTHEFESLKCSDNSTVSDWKSWFDYANNVIKMTIPEGKLDMSNGKYYTLRVKLIPTDTAIQSNVRYVDIQFYGIVNGSGTDAVSYRLDTNASVINYQDGSLYPSMIEFYLTKSDGDVVTQIRPNEPSSWTFSYSTDGGSEWKHTSQKEIPTEGQDGMYFRAQNGSLDFKEYVPIIKAPAVEGINGVTYKIEVSNMSLSYKANESNKYNISSTFTVKLYKKEGNADYDLQETAGYNCNVSTNPSITVTPPTKSDNQWDCSISGEVSSSSATIQIIINNDNGAFVDSITIPISAAGKDGSAGTGQTFKGSPLRMRGSYDKNNKPYYDGKRDAENGVFYQDIVIYNNIYYVCVNTKTGNQDSWNTAPDAASYWQKFAVTENFVAEKIISNQAYIKELSSNEIVIFDGGTIVAGMTSSKTIDSKSDLNGNVTKKGDVRIWAGGMQKEGDLTSAPFTVTDAGVLKCQSAEGNSITLQDGTIYFNINGSVYHLGITNGKPDWINSNAADSTETWYQKRGSDTNLSFSQVGAFAIKDNKYYTDATMKTPVSGTYYKKVDNSTILYQVGIYTFLTYGYLFGVEVYNKASFTNGTKNMQGTVATTGSVLVNTIPSQSPSGEIGGTLNVITTNKSWAKISKVDKPTGVFTYYIAYTSGSSSDSIPYTRIKQDGVTFNYNTNNGIYVMSASDTEIPNLSSMLSSWRTNVGTGISDVVYEIRNNNLTGGFVS